jgi:hypothetical protein
VDVAALYRLGARKHCDPLAVSAPEDTRRVVDVHHPCRVHDRYRHCQQYCREIPLSALWQSVLRMGPRRLWLQQLRQEMPELRIAEVALRRIGMKRIQAPYSDPLQLDHAR